MADSATTRRSDRRARWKLWTLPGLAAVAALASSVLLGYHPVGAFLNIWQTLLLALGGPERLLPQHPRIAHLLELAAGPVVWLMLLFGIVKIPPVRGLIDRLFPDPPDFVLGDLDVQRRRSMVTLKRALPAFVGRDTECAALRGLLDRRATPDPFRWRSVLGPSGIGKSRLAIEWLAVAQAEGWDVGIVDPEDHARLAGWRPRRATALVIDEARSRWDKELARAMLALGAHATARKPVRLLVLDQIAPYVMDPDGAMQQRLDAARIDPAMMVRPLTAAQIGLMAGDDPAFAARIVAKSAGRPRAAIILANFPDAADYASALRRWAELLVPDLSTDSATPPRDFAVPLIFAALVGPVVAEAIRPHVTDYDPGPLHRFFDGADHAVLKDALPALLPDDLAQELALRLLPKLDTPRRDAMIGTMLDCAPARMEASLGAIWRDRPDLDGARAGDGIAVTLRELQAAFDAAYPERVRALVEQADTLVDVTADLDRYDTLDAVLETLVHIVETRPFDPAFRLREATGAINAIYYWGEHERWDDLERWGKRLVALAEDPRFAADPAIRLEEATGAVNAISCYGEHKRWDDLERWGQRLIALADDQRFAADPVIRLHEAMSAMNAITDYGEHKRWGDLERWGQRLIALADDQLFTADPAIRLREAMGAVNAINRYGEHKRWDDLERWGQRLIALADDQRFAADPVIRLHEAMGAMNAIGRFGEHRRWDDLERWGQRLIAIADDQLFAADPAIRLHEAMGAVNAINRYGEHKRWDDLERWGQRLIALADDQRFAADPAIRLQEAEGAMNAINRYGEHERWDDLERWGQRLIALADDQRFAADPAIRLHEAKGTVNAIGRYGEHERWDDLERWGQRLIAVARDQRFAADPAIRLREAMGAVNAINRYGSAGLHGSGRHFAWKRRLAFVAQAFPADPEIQELARRHDLTWVSQQRANFRPYGRAPALPATGPAAPATAA